jgi:ABC-type branched-subunit amino acid transport system ATPase component
MTTNEVAAATASPPATAGGRGEPVLEVEGVTKAFGGLVAVDDVSLTAGARAITAVIGPNGAGKTTLFNLISGFDRPDRGEIRLGGEAVARLTPAKMAAAGVVRTFQTPVGFPTLSVWENLMVSGTGARAGSLRSALLGTRAWGPDLRGADERATRLMEELELSTLRDMRLEDLSPGVNKLVEFARQLMMEPGILLLDEPAAGVDPASLGRLAELIRGLTERGIAVVMIDHNLDFILGLADYVYVLAEGAVIAEGEPRAVAADPLVIETYLGRAS